jgi:ABC-type polysaccharide/polyol phosphate transport system ATPase subunit
MAVINSIQCDGLWKAYHDLSAFGIKHLLTGKVAFKKAGRYAREWTLQDINFSVSPGSGFGIIGHNGSGKSTLLSLLLGVISADKGTIKITGRVASLLELDSGFHPELSGRDNVYLYGSILGMTIKEIKALYNSIVEFSELGEALNFPLRTYSAGMAARLGFATIIHYPADILLIDEVLAVGDASFQAKCYDYLLRFKQNGGTLAIVSHDMQALRGTCEQGICLEQGSIVQQGDIQTVIDYYSASLTSPIETITTSSNPL